MSLVTTVHDQRWETWDDPVRGCLRWCLLADGTDPSPEAVTTGVAELDHGGWMGRHRHAAPEVYYVLSGRAVVTLDGEEVTVEAGALVRIPGDVEHGVRADGGPVRVLFVFPTAGFADVVYRFRGRGRLSGPQRRRRRSISPMTSPMISVIVRAAHCGITTTGTSRRIVTRSRFSRMKTIASTASTTGRNQRARYQGVGAVVRGALRGGVSVMARTSGGLRSPMSLPVPARAGLMRRG